MPSSIVKQIIKPIYHIGALTLLIIVFIVLNLLGVINENTPVPDELGSLLQSIFSVRSIYLLPFIFLLLVALNAKLRPRMTDGHLLRKCSFWVLALLTGKFYTLGAFLIAWAIAANYVSYVTPIPNSIALGIFAIVLGWGIWLLARAIAALTLKQS